MPRASSTKNQAEEVERVYRLLREWLITAQLPPGEFLSDAVLGEAMQDQPNPVREACSGLAQDKCLYLIPVEATIKPISVRDIVELYEFRKLLECFSAERVARASTPECVAQLRNIDAVKSDGERDLKKILLANEAFHVTLAEMAGDQCVIDQLQLALCYLRPLDTMCTQTVPSWIGHREIVRAIEQGKLSEARRAITKHVDASLEKMIRLSGG
jgi:DNA-binding GntR family transcriptional regulator